MEQLRVIGTEDDRLILATESGARFHLAVDDVLRHELRKSRRERHQDSGAPRPSPRDIQAQIRAGLSATETAELLGISREDVQRFEGPVLAERDHMVGQALAIPVLLGNDLDHEMKPTFGSAVRTKLEEAHATGERWTSWKEHTGWVIKLEFTAADVEHDARWAFDPRRSTLAPQNADAVQLSRQGSLPDGLIPRLRALDSSSTDSGPPQKDDSRFDSNSFGLRRQRAESRETDQSTDPPVPESSSHAVREAAVKHAVPEPATSPDTADLLEALRRRRGQREPQPRADDDAGQADPAEGSDPHGYSHGAKPEYDDGNSNVPTPDLPDYPEPVLLFDGLESPADVATSSSSSSSSSSTEADSTQEPPDARRKRRAAMPSWDEIVFGARTDE